MAVGKAANSPLTHLQENFQLRAKVQEGVVLGPQGAETTLIQKLALTSQPSRKQISAAAAPPKKEDGKAITEAAPARKKSKLGVVDGGKKEPVKTETKTAAAKPSLGAEGQAKIANVYSGSDGFKAVA